jgi:hypothetical protein
MDEGRYIALSHCWGSAQHCTLTSETLPEFKASIPWHILPKTFQDATIFSTKLDVYYIWIDALCIIQDDPTDWEIESAKMADIYQDSYLTLAATGSSNDVGGCFPPGEYPATAAEYELSVRRSLFHSHHIMVRKKVEHWTWPPSKASTDIHPLLSRGWAFQERILSPRVLHFCKQELLWECRGETVCECGSLPTLSEMKKHFLVTGNPEEPGPPNDSLSNTSPPEPVLVHEPFSGLLTGYPLESTDGFGRAVTASSISRPFVDSNSQPKEKGTRRKPWRRVFRKTKVKKAHEESEAETLEQRGLKGKERKKKVEKLDEESEVETLEQMRTDEALEQQWRLTEEEWKKKVVGNVLMRDAAENWHRVIEQYSALNLTIQTDRLPALSGLAVRSSPILGGYLSGLWTENIVSDLMWRVNLLEVGTGRGDEYISPTWSWASITGPVTYWTKAKNGVPTFPREQVPPLAVSELQNRVRRSSFAGKVEIIGTNPYGIISSGTLIVDGYLKPARLLWVSTRTGGSRGKFDAKVEPVPLKYDLEINPAAMRPGYNQFDLELGFANMWVPPGLGILREHEHLDPDGFPYLELPFFADYILREEGPHQIPDKGSLTLLLLHPSICLVLKADESQSMTYRRVGIVRQPWEQVSIYGVDWMLGSEFKKEIRII